MGGAPLLATDECTVKGTGLTFIKGTPIVLDPAGPLYAAIGAGNLRPYVQGQDDRGGAALSN